MRKGERGRKWVKPGAIKRQDGVRRGKMGQKEAEWGKKSRNGAKKSWNGAIKHQNRVKMGEMGQKEGE